MRCQQILSKFVVATCAIICLIATGAVEAQQLPKAVTIGTNPPGTVFYALAGGLAKVATEATPIQVNIQPYAVDRESALISKVACLMLQRV